MLHLPRAAGDESGSSLALPEWLSSWQRFSLPTDKALHQFDGLAAVDPDEMIGTWRGSGLHTGHSLDGLLERYNWYGKRFESFEAVHPLLFRHSNGAIYSVDPARVPLGFALRTSPFAQSGPGRILFLASRVLLQTSSPGARLRKIEHRCVASAAIVYDRQPIIDHLRRVDGNHVLGAMDLRSMQQPFFFLLSREQD